MSLPLPWFRMYGEFLTDPVIRLLSFEDQRHFVAALCMKSAGYLDKRYASVTVRRNVISSLIGLSAETSGAGLCALDQANERIRALGLIDEDWQPTNWDKRQFQSDHVDRTAAERMRRYRANRNVTPVTPVVTALDSDAEQSRRSARNAPRPPGSLITPDWRPDAQALVDLTTRYASQGVDVETEIERFVNHSLKDAVLRRDHLAGFRNWLIKAKEFRERDGVKPEASVTTIGGKKLTWS